MGLCSHSYSHTSLSHTLSPPRVSTLPGTKSTQEGTDLLREVRKKLKRKAKRRQLKRRAQRRQQKRRAQRRQQKRKAQRKQLKREAQKRQLKRKAQKRQLKRKALRRQKQLKNKKRSRQLSNSARAKSIRIRHRTSTKWSQPRHTEVLRSTVNSTMLLRTMNLLLLPTQHCTVRLTVKEVKLK